MWSTIADVLTGGRLVLALPLGILAYQGRWGLAAALLALGWWTDFLDGRFARMTETPTRFGSSDLLVDTVVGVGLFLGGALGGHMAAVLVGAETVVILGFGITRNPALAMLAQAIPYALVLWLSYPEGGVGFPLAVASIGVIALMGMTRFRTVTLPAFFGGIAHLWRSIGSARRAESRN